MDDLLTTYPWLFPLFAVVLWCFALSLLARFGGWSALAEHYAGDQAYEGEKKFFQSMSIHRRRGLPLGLNNVVTVAADAAYLHLAMFVLFRPFHAPLRIPWTDISTEARQTLTGPGVAFIASREPTIRLIFERKLADHLAQKSGRTFADIHQPGHPGESRDPARATARN